MCPLHDNSPWRGKQGLWWKRDGKEDRFGQFHLCKTIWCYKRHDNKQYFISLLNSLIWPKKFYYLLIFIRNIPRNRWQAKWETFWIYFSAKFFVLFFFFKLCICMLKLWTWYHWWPQNGNANACLCIVDHLFIDMLMKCMLIP